MPRKAFGLKRRLTLPPPLAARQETHSGSGPKITTSSDAATRASGEDAADSTPGLAESAQLSFEDDPRHVVAVEEP